jgi:SecD/SecF fusion protein
MLLVFGGDTLKAFAFAMMVGIASGTYSSIFIASPVLTAWKEREPALAGRRARIEAAMGHVPAFVEQVEVAKLEDGEEPLEVAEPEPRPRAQELAIEEQPSPQSAHEVELPEEEIGDGAPETRDDDLVEAGAAADPERPSKSERKRRQRQRRRKHGRNR